MEEAPGIRKGKRISMPKKRSRVRFNNIKMDLNFNSKSPIISRISIINELGRLSKKSEPPAGVLGRKPC